MIITDKNVSMCNWRVQKVEQANYSKTFQNLIIDLEKFACKAVQYSGLQINTRPLVQASVKTTWANTNLSIFLAFIKGTSPMESAVNPKFPSLNILRVNIQS